MKLPATFPSLDTTDEVNLRHLLTQMLGRIAVAFNNPDFGTTAARPTHLLVTGQPYFDTTLGKPIWWNAALVRWVDATGAVV